MIHYLLLVKLMWKHENKVEKKRKNIARTLYRHECEPVTQMQKHDWSCCGMRGYASFGRWALSIEG